MFQIKIVTITALIIIIAIILMVANFLVYTSSNWYGSQYEFHFLANLLNKDSQQTSENLLSVNTKKVLGKYNGELNQRISELQDKLDNIDINGENMKIIGKMDSDFDNKELINMAKKEIKEIKDKGPNSLQQLINKYLVNNNITNDVVTMTSNIKNMKTQLNNINENINKLSDRNLMEI